MESSEISSKSMNKFIIILLLVFKFIEGVNSTFNFEVTILSIEDGFKNRSGVRAPHILDLFILILILKFKNTKYIK